MSTAFLPQAGPDAKPLLRFLTCGSVDDGKSTLIGRLLYDTGQVYEDQLAALAANSKKVNGNPDLSLLVDGLQAEREQGITIDVAYRYFHTPKRSFIIADTPGHEQYTRNMVTGASHADLGLILIDASQGVLAQTRRHAIVLSLLGIKQVAVVINKMDLVGYKAAIFSEIKEEVIKFFENLAFTNVQVIPISAVEGDNVVNASTETPWYNGPTLLEFLESAEIHQYFEENAFRLPVQLVLRPDANFRGYAGTISSGNVAVGDQIIALPSRQKAIVKSIHKGFTKIQNAKNGASIAITLDRNIDISRGDILVKAADSDIPTVSKSFVADLVWMDSEPWSATKEYYVQFQTASIPGRVVQINHELAIHTNQPNASTKHLQLNQIASVTVELSRNYPLDLYDSFHYSGSFVLIDRLTNQTAAAGMIRRIESDSNPASNLKNNETAGLLKGLSSIELAEFNSELLALITRYFPKNDEAKVLAKKLTDSLEGLN